MSKIEVDAIDKQSGSTLTLGGSGTAVTLAAGATQSGFGRSGSVNWDTTAKTAGFTGVSGNGYFINTTAGAITVNLPASPSAGDIMAIKDYTGTFSNNACTVARNGSNIRGAASNFDLAKNNAGATFIYVDATEGWQAFVDGSDSDAQQTFISATGGNSVITCGDYKTHIFTGPGTFCVACVGCAGSNDIVDYMVVAGGGAGGPGYAGGGGGAGGFRISNCATRSGIPAPTMSPLVSTTGLTVTQQGYPISIGAGGSPTPAPAPCASVSAGGNGVNSVFSSITSTGGGGGGTGGQGGGSNPNAPAGGDGKPGGSGGGAGSKATDSSNAPQAGTGNTPPVSPAQGTNGGSAGADGFSAFTNTAGGGGAGAAGTSGSSQSTAATGGVGSFLANAAIGPTAPSYGTAGPVSSTRYFAGGGGGATDSPGGHPVPQGLGGAGGGGNGAANTSGAGVAGTVNTGGAGGGAAGPSSTAPFNAGAAGGSGIVIIRYRFQ